MPPQRPAAQSTGGGFGPRPHLPASSKGFGTMEKSARAMRRRGRVLHVLPSLWRLCSGAWRWRTSQCRPAPRVVDGHSEEGGPPSAMRSACSRVYGDFVSAGVLHLNAALLLSHSRILRGALRTTSGGEPASISTALPYSRLSPHGCPSLLRWPSYLQPNGLDSSGRAAGATESSARGTFRNAVSSCVNVGCVGEAA